MTIVADIEEVTTEDADPHSAPFKISAKPTKNVATFVWKVTAGSVIRAWRVRLNPLNRNTGQLVKKQGMVCGSGDRCGPNTRSLAVASPLEVTTSIQESEVASEPDGEIEVAVFARSESDGWSS